MIYVFDLGGVLLDWDPMHLYQKLAPLKTARWFLDNICTLEWNHQQDLGRSLAAGTHLLQTKHPQYAEWIGAYYSRWIEMNRGLFSKNLACRNQLKNSGAKVIALTNFARENLKRAYQKYPELSEFDASFVSSDFQIGKPDTRIYEIVMESTQAPPAEHVFFEDRRSNIKAAEQLGWRAFQIEKDGDIELALSQLQSERI